MASFARSSILSVASLLILGNAGQAQRLDSQFADEIGLDQKLNEQVPLDLEFTNEKGQQVSLGDYFGEKPIALALVYYECPMPGFLMWDVLRGTCFTTSQRLCQG